jgi:hypothetical protein
MDRYSVVILTGQPDPKMVKAVGPFDSTDDADVWIDDQGYTRTPGSDEWAVVLPAETP